MSVQLPPYAVPGRTPVGGSADLRSVQYGVDQLAAEPPVAAALARTPELLLAIRLDEPLWEEEASTRRELAEQLWVGTGDGCAWELSLGEGVKSLVQTGEEFYPGDPLAEALSAQGAFTAVDHYEREVFHVRTDAVRRADELAAHWLEAVVTAHRAFAARRGVALPY